MRREPPPLCVFKLIDGPAVSPYVARFAVNMTDGKAPDMKTFLRFHPIMFVGVTEDIVRQKAHEFWESEWQSRARAEAGAERATAARLRWRSERDSRR